MTIREIIYSLAAKNHLILNVAADSSKQNLYEFSLPGAVGDVQFRVLHDYGAIASIRIHPQEKLVWEGIRSDRLKVLCCQENKVDTNQAAWPLRESEFKADAPTKIIAFLVLSDHFADHLGADPEQIDTDLNVGLDAIGGAPCSPAFAQILEQITSAPRSPDPVYDALYFDSKFDELMSLILKRSATREHSHMLPKAWEDDLQSVAFVAKYIDDHLEENPGLVALAGMVYMSPSKLKALFKETSGYTISEYRAYRRIYVSRDLLENTDLSVAEIARRCGYQKVSNFTTFFRKYMDLSPREYRASLQK